MRSVSIGLLWVHSSSMWFGMDLLLLHIEYRSYNKKTQEKWNGGLKSQPPPWCAKLLLPKSDWVRTIGTALFDPQWWNTIHLEVADLHTKRRKSSSDWLWSGPPILKSDRALKTGMEKSGRARKIEWNWRRIEYKPRIWPNFLPTESLLVSENRTYRWRISDCCPAMQPKRGGWIEFLKF